MARRRLFLHIGPHKTGTSSFQKSLELNAQALIAQGVRPLTEAHIKHGTRTGRERAALHSLADLFIRPDLPTGMRLRDGVQPLTDRQKRNRRGRVAARLAAMTDPAVVLSAESFCYLRTPQERALIQSFLTETRRAATILLVRRNAEDWRASWLSQMRRGTHGPDWASHMQQEQAERSEWYFDLQALRAFWAPLPIVEVDFDAVPNIVPALYRAMDVDPSGLLTDLRLNPRRD